MRIRTPFVRRSTWARCQEIAVEMKHRRDVALDDLDDTLRALEVAERKVESIRVSRDEEIARNLLLSGQVAYLSRYGLRIGRLDGDELREEIQRRDELVRWLALPWGDRDPELFARDPHSGQDLEGNVRLRETWLEVVRGIPRQSLGDTPREQESSGEIPPSPLEEG